MAKNSNFISAKQIKSILKIIFPFIFFAIILFEGRKELSSIKINDVKIALKSMPPFILVLFTVGGIITASTSFIHDRIISKEFSIRLSKLKTFKISYIANTLNNVMGGISSAGVRVFLYGKEGIKPKEAAYYNIMIITSFSTGISVLTLFILFNIKNIRPIFEQYEFSLIATIIVLFFIPTYYLINKMKWIRNKLIGEDHRKFASTKVLTKLLLSSVIEWTITSLFFTFMTLYFSPKGGFINIFSVFVISSSVGIVSLMPGAIGAFDVTLLLGMSVINIDSHKAVASLMMFRLFYYILPLIIALFLAIPGFLKQKNNGGEY